MNAQEIIDREWLRAYEDMLQTEGFQRIAKGDLTKEHYIAVLRQLFHQVRATGGLMGQSVAKLKGRQREIVRLFFGHAVSEVGHEQLIIQDLKAMGVDTTTVPYERPMPSTMTLIGTPGYLIENESPLVYMGFINHFETLSIHAGINHIELFKRIGIPENAFSFITVHSEVDVGHKQMMEKYIAACVNTKEDLDSFVYGFRLAARIYANVIAEAIRSVEREEKPWGFQRAELRAAFPEDYQEIEEAFEISREAAAEKIKEVKAAKKKLKAVA